jgi:hypothetical protein
MSQSSEAHRIEHNVHCEPAPRVEIRVLCKSGSNPEVQLAHVRDVMRIVAQQRAKSQWPADEWWRSALPSWFLQPFEGRTMEQVLENPNLWDFGSWLDAMKYTGWEWWSSGRTHDGWMIRLWATSDPYSVGPLEYLARAAGVHEITIEEGRL